MLGVFPLRPPLHMVTLSTGRRLSRGYSSSSYTWTCACTGSAEPRGSANPQEKLPRLNLPWQADKWAPAQFLFYFILYFYSILFYIYIFFFHGKLNMMGN